MGPRQWQQQIRSTFSPQEGDWINFRYHIANSSQDTSQFGDFSDHVMREFNKKVYSLGFGGLAFTPHDGGLRYVGSLGNLMASSFLLNPPNTVGSYSSFVVDEFNETVIDSNFNPILS